MTRTHWLLLTVFVLAVTNGTYHWWRGRGLVTIHCEDWPATKVAHEIERQGGITLKTNLTDAVKIRMQVDKVPVAEALETFATVAEARWRLAYIFAPQLPQAHGVLTSVVSGERPEGWKTLHIPTMLSPFEEGGVEPDPRADLWNVKPEEKPEFQAYASQAAKSVNAAILYPENWNPAVSKPPASAPIHKSAPALAKAAGGRVLEVFVVTKRERDPADGPRGEGPPGEDGSRFAGFGRRGPRDPNRPEPTEEERERMRAAFAQRQQAEIDKLPPDQRAAADERRKFFEGLRDLTPEERKAKLEEYFSNPANQERMEQRMSERDARMTPDQRVQKAGQYVQRKESARNQAAGR
jgi:hypothetical protein